MHPYTVKFGGGLDVTVLNPLIVLIAVTAIVLTYVLPRKYTVAPFLIALFLTPEGQQLYVGGIHLFLNRIVVLATFLRGITSREPRGRLFAAGWTPIDTAFVAYVLICATATLVQYPSIAAVINQIGFLWDFVLGYLALRMLIRSEREMLVALKCLAVLMVILGAEMLYEQTRLINLFGLLGGVSSVPEIRNGKIRSQGVFQHALTAGAFAAPAISLFLLLWKSRSARWIVIPAIAAATAMVVMTQTSTSLITEAAGILAICLWPLRRKMRALRIGLVMSFVGLAVIMKAPVWFLIAHIDLTGSSSGYQRAELINQFVDHFSSWWLIGSTNVSSWGWDMWDAQNMFVSVGEAGGLTALVFFILVISRSFGWLGKARQRAASKSQEWTIWLLGAALFANVVSFFGVNYFDQVRVAWFALLSMICATAGPILQRRSLAKVTVKLQTTGDPTAVLREADEHPESGQLHRRRMTQ